MLLLFLFLLSLVHVVHFYFHRFEECDGTNIRSVLRDKSLSHTGPACSRHADVLVVGQERPIDDQPTRSATSRANNDSIGRRENDSQLISKT